MEPYLLQTSLAFVAGIIVGIIILLLISKVRTGSMTSSGVKEEYQEYQEQVEQHFEETSKKFKDMTEQYQDLYKHLSVGATSLCRPDSVAAVMADKSEPTIKLEKKNDDSKNSAKVTDKAANNDSAVKKEPVVSKEEPSASKVAPGTGTQATNKLSTASEAQKNNQQKRTLTPEEAAAQKLALARKQAVEQKQAAVKKS